MKQDRAGPCHTCGVDRGGTPSCLLGLILEGHPWWWRAWHLRTASTSKGGWLKTASRKGSCPSGHQGLMSGNLGCGKVGPGGRVKLRVQGVSMTRIFTSKPREGSYKEGESKMEE